MKIPALIAVLGLLAATSAGAADGGAPAHAASDPATAYDDDGTTDGEVYRYRWHLGSLLGRVAGLFLPSRGDGVLSFRPLSDGHLRSDLLITSEKSRDGEYWRYGSELDPDTGHTRRAWSSYRWRGEEKKRDAEIDRRGVMDVVSGIWAIRQDPPTRSRHMEIWSDGKIYPVMVVPRGRETLEVDGRRVATRHFSIRGYRTDRTSTGGEVRRWKGSMELWLTIDETATPVEIRISRNLADLRLELQSLPAR